MAGPPEGWYEDTDRAGYKRWWDGVAWTDHRQEKEPAKAVRVVQKPPSLGDVKSRVSPAPTPMQGSTKCPSCHQSDAIQRLSVVIDSGLTTSAGSATTLTTGGNIAVTGFNSSTTTRLSARISPPPRPAFPAKGVLFLLWFLCSIVSVIWVAISSGSVFTGLLVGLLLALITWLPALVLMLLIAAMTSNSYKTAQADWDQKAKELRSAYYCSRDDVVFSGDFAASPEAFRARIFPTSS